MRNFKKLLVILTSILLITMLAPFSALAEYDPPLPRHAPNMYVDWPNDGSSFYDVMTVDWYCEIDAENTYWAVHNWANGYAGFQNKDGEHVLLLSLWDWDDGTRPTIEYAKDGASGDFGGEGTGKQVFTNYAWQTGKWYTMRVQVWTANGKSYFGQWVREAGGEWVKTAVISYPVTDLKFSIDSMFQEDFTFNNLLRKCRLRNAFGRFYGTTEWDSWVTYLISNTYFPTDPPDWEYVEWNVNYDCDWGIGSDSDYVWVQSGGGDFSSNGYEYGTSYPFLVDQASKPSSPEWLSAKERNDDSGNPLERGERSGRDATAPAVPVVTIPENAVIATPGADNSANASIPDEIVGDAIIKALDGAAAQGKGATAAKAAISVMVPQGTASLSVVLSQNALRSLVSAGLNGLAISNGNSLPSITLDLKALKTFQKQAGSNVTIKITSAPKLSKYAKKLIADRPVFSIAATYEKDGKLRNITSLNGSGIIAIPYTFRPGEMYESVFGISIGSKGNAVRVKGSMYDPESGCIIIPVKKLSSAYGIGSR